MLDAIVSIVVNEVTISVALGTLSLFLGKKVKQYKSLVISIADVYIRYRDTAAPDSPAGEVRTPAEWSAIGKEVIDVIQAAGNLIEKRSTK